MVHTAFSCFISRGNEPWTIKNSIPDSQKTQPAKNFTEIVYPKPDGVLSFDLLTSLSRSGKGLRHCDLCVKNTFPSLIPTTSSHLT
jgi:hypothetical protein